MGNPGTKWRFLARKVIDKNLNCCVYGGDPPVSSNMAKEHRLFICDFPKNTCIYRGFSIGMFDYQRVSLICFHGISISLGYKYKLACMWLWCVPPLQKPQLHRVITYTKWKWTITRSLKLGKSTIIDSLACHHIWLVEDTCKNVALPNGLGVEMVEVPLSVLLENRLPLVHHQISITDDPERLVYSNHPWIC